MQVPCPVCQAPIPVPIFALGPLEAPVPVLCPRCRQAVELRQGKDGVVSATATQPARRSEAAAADTFFQGRNSGIVDTAQRRAQVPQRSRDAEMLREFSVMFRQAATRSWGATIATVLLGAAAVAGVAFGVWWYMERQNAGTEADDALAAATALSPDGTTAPGSAAAPKSSLLGEHLQAVQKAAPSQAPVPGAPGLEIKPSAAALPRDVTPSAAVVLEPVNRRQLDAMCHAKTTEIQACARKFANGAAVDVHFTLNVIGQIEGVRAEVDGNKLTELTVCTAEVLRDTKFGYQPEEVHHGCEFKGLQVVAPKATHTKSRRSR